MITHHLAASQNWGKQTPDQKNIIFYLLIMLFFFDPTNISPNYGAFTLNVKSVLNENLGGILGGTQC
jgi:hypothetical protein